MSERMMVRYGAIVTALSSISHIGDVSGTVSPFRREKIVMADGTVEEVPVYSGNATRGLLRDHGAMFLLEGSGHSGDGDKYGWLSSMYSDDAVVPAMPPTRLPLKRFYQLFSGGALDKKEKSKKGQSVPLDLGTARRLRELVPFLAVWGAAVGNQMLPGLLKCGKLIPIAIETEHLLPPDVVEKATGGTWELQSVHDLMSIEAYTRTDDAKNERLREYLVDAPVDDDKAPQQMRYEVETLAAGTKFWWMSTLEMATELERAAWESAILRWGQNPIIGGMGRVGHGLVRVEGDGQAHRIPIIVDAQNANVMPDSRERVEMYAEYLINNAEEIRALLGAE